MRSPANGRLDGEYTRRVSLQTELGKGRASILAAEMEAVMVSGVGKRGARGAERRAWMEESPAGCPREVVIWSEKLVMANAMDSKRTDPMRCRRR